jgi:hypothetical protein
MLDDTMLAMFDKFKVFANSKDDGPSADTIDEFVKHINLIDDFLNANKEDPIIASFMTLDNLGTKIQLILLGAILMSLNEK